MLFLVWTVWIWTNFHIKCILWNGLLTEILVFQFSIWSCSSTSLMPGDCEVCKWLVFYHCLRYSFTGTLRCPKCPSLRTTVRHWPWHLGLQDSMANRSFLAWEVHPLLQIMNESGFPFCSQQHVELSRCVLFSFCVSRGNMVSDCSCALRNMLVTVGRAGTFCIGAKIKDDIKWFWNDVAPVSEICFVTAWL